MININDLVLGNISLIFVKIILNKYNLISDSGKINITGVTILDNKLILNKINDPFTINEMPVLNKN